MNSEVLLSIVSITLLVFLLVAGIVITLFVAGRQRIRQEMAMTSAKLTFEKELRQVETEVSENMMSQFAQELHDNIGQLLTALHIQVENQKLDHPQLIESFKPVEIYLTEINQQLRMLSRTFNNDYIGRVGLIAAIQLEVDRLKTLKRFSVQFKNTPGNSNLEKNQELMVFRIFQEIVQNALRHSTATELEITIHNNNNQFELWVRDNGKGFEKEEIINSNKASGLRNILKRAKLAGLECTITSSSGEGCLFVLKKPLS
jgi:signal transduction histidine kinase